MEIDEEEVVFEGSPLAEHLRECGMQVTLEKIMSVTQPDKTSIAEYIRRKAGSIINLVQRVVNPPIFKNNTGILEVIEQIVKFNLVDVDDLAIIKNFSSDASLQVPHKWSLIPKAVLEITLVSVPSVILKMIPKMKIHGKYISMLALLLFIYRWYPVFHGSVDLKNMKKLLDLTAEFDRKTKKALTQIVDHNTINQGYLMTRESHQIWNLEAGEIKELAMRSRSVLPGLRVALQSSTRRVTVAFSQATCKLRSERPLPAHLDAEPFYLPDVDDDDSMWFKLKDGEEEVSIPTIRTLKSTVDILKLKRSEFFRRLVLGAIMDDEQYMGFSGSYITLLYKVIMGALKELDLGIIFHYSYVRSPIVEEDKHGKQTSIGVDLGNCFKSCTLHLQEALFNSTKLEDSLSSFISKTSQDRNTFSETSSRILHHLTSAKLCIRHAEILNEKMNSSSMVKATNESAVGNDDLQLPGTVDTDISHSEFIPQDEIFEMYFGGDDVPPTPSEDNRESLEIDHQHSAVLMSELKGVLKFRAAEWKERENKVKRRQGSLVDSDESKEQEVSHKFKAEYRQDGASGSGLVGKKHLANATSCLSTEQGLSQNNVQSTVAPEEGIRIPSILGKIELGGGNFTCVIPKEKGVCSVSRRLGFEDDFKGSHSISSNSEVAKEQELSFYKYMGECRQEGTIGSGQEGEIPSSEAASCFSPEDNLSPGSACLVKTAEKNIKGSSVFDKLEFDGGYFTCENVIEKGISSVSGRQGLEVDSESRCSACNSPEVTKEQELSFDKHLTEYKQEVTSGSEHIVGIPLADNTISEKKLTPISVCSVKLEERDIEGTSAFDRLEFDGGHFTYINSRESEVSNISMEPNDHMDKVKSGLGVRALAAEAVAKARATKSPSLMEEEFTFVGDEEDEG